YCWLGYVEEGMYVRAVQLTSHSQLLQNCASLWICQGFAYTIEFFGCQFHYVNSRRSACVLAFRYLSIHQQDTSTANPRERIDVYQYIYIPTAAKHSAEKNGNEYGQSRPSQRWRL